MKTQDRLNCMAQVIAPPVSKGYYGGTCTLAIQGSNEIQLGALKVCFPIWIMPTHVMSLLDQYDFYVSFQRLCQQSASNLKSVIYEPSSRRK